MTRRPSCKQVTRMEVEQNPGSDAQAADATGLCPVCRTAAARDTVECMHCHGVHHRDCWDYNSGCGKYGCASAPPTEKLNELEVPASYWGLDEKECPVCQNRIQAAAMRCRHCGTVFATTRPQQVGEFHAARTVKDDLPRLRRSVVILLVFSVLPCTAAITAIVGGIWYARNRTRLAALPTTQVAMAKIALLIAIGQTVLLMVVAVLHACLG
jgi:hypothetical protein